MTRRQQLAIITLLGLLAVTAAWSTQRMHERRDAALAAHEALAETRDLVGSIEHLRHQPARAAAQRIAATELTRRIEAATAEAGIDASQLDMIAPEPPRRLGDSAYQQRPTQVLLRRVDLASLSRFLTAATRDAEGELMATSLRLTAPHRGDDDDPDERWRAEITFSDLIYAPRQARH